VSTPGLARPQRDSDSTAANLPSEEEASTARLSVLDESPPQRARQAWADNQQEEDNG